MKHNSDFKYDLKLGVLGEKLIADVLNNKKLEVKTDYKATKTGNVFVEYSSRGHRSGVATTQAEFYVFILSNENMIIISTEKLREKCRRYIATSRDVVGGDNNTSNGILLPVNELI